MERIYKERTKSLSFILIFCLIHNKKKPKSKHFFLSTTSWKNTGTVSNVKQNWDFFFPLFFFSLCQSISLKLILTHDHPKRLASLPEARNDQEEFVLQAHCFRGRHEDKRDIQKALSVLLPGGRQTSTRSENYARLIIDGTLLLLLLSLFYSRFHKSVCCMYAQNP